MLRRRDQQQAGEQAGEQGDKQADEQADKRASLTEGSWSYSGAKASLTVRNLMKKYDKDGDRKFDNNEVAGIVLDVLKESKLKTQYKKVAWMLSAFIVFFLASNAALTYTVLFLSRETKVSKSGMLIALDSNSVAQTAVAKQTLALGLASYMTNTERMTIDKILLTMEADDVEVDEDANTTYSYEDEESDDSESDEAETYYVQRSFGVVGFQSDFDTHVKFDLHDGGTLTVIDGDAWYDAAPDEDGMLGLPVSVCTTNVECAQYQADGLDVDALLARANETSPDGRRRALAQADGGCSDGAVFDLPLNDLISSSNFTDEMADALAAVNDTIANATDDVVAIARRALRRQLAAQRDGRASASATTSNKQRWYQQMQEWDVAEDLKQFAADEAGAAIDETGAAAQEMAWEFYENNRYTTASSDECKAVLSELDDLKATYNDVESQLEGVNTHLGTAIQFCADIEDLHDKVNTARTAFSKMGTYVDLLKCCSGPMKSAGSIAKVALNALETSVNAVYKITSKLDSKARAIKARFESAEEKTATLIENMALVEDTFDHAVYRQLLIADNICPSVTSSAVCTDSLKTLLQTANGLSNKVSLPTLPSVTALQAAIDFKNQHWDIMKLFAFTAVINFLKPISDFLNKKRCVTWKESYTIKIKIFRRKIKKKITIKINRCFRIKDIFNNFLVKFVNGIIDSFLKPLMSPLQALFAPFLLPSLNIGTDILDNLASDLAPTIDFSDLKVGCFDDFTTVETFTSLNSACFDYNEFFTLPSAPMCPA